jgi:hypothetical protein
VGEGWRKKGLREREESEGGMSERGGWRRRESVREGEECEEGWERDGGRGYEWREGIWIEGGERDGGRVSVSVVCRRRSASSSIRLSSLFVVVVLRRRRCDVAANGRRPLAFGER